jgi:hypothetical protein
VVVSIVNLQDMLVYPTIIISGHSYINKTLYHRRQCGFTIPTMV